MKDSPEKISPLRRRMIEDMRMRKMSSKTQSMYIRAVQHFAGYLGRSPATASDEDLRRYQLHCVDRGVLADYAQRHDHGAEVLRGLPNPCPSGSTSLDSCAHAGRSRTIL